MFKFEKPVALPTPESYAAEDQALKAVLLDSSEVPDALIELHRQRALQYPATDGYHVYTRAFAGCMQRDGPSGYQVGMSGRRWRGRNVVAPRSRPVPLTHAWRRAYFFLSFFPFSSFLLADWPGCLLEPRNPMTQSAVPAVQGCDAFWRHARASLPERVYQPVPLPTPSSHCSDLESLRAVLADTEAGNSVFRFLIRERAARSPDGYVAFALATIRTSLLLSLRATAGQTQRWI